MSGLVLNKNLSKTKICVYFSLIIGGGFIFRYIFFPFDIPLILDSLSYFWYGIDLSVTKNFPTTDIANNLWPTFLSLFFSATNSENYLDFMFVQRNMSMLFSVMTSIPMYFLAKRFVRRDIALIAPLFFVFEPRIIENSLAGVTEPMFIFFIVSSLALFFSNQKKLILFSFVLAGIICLVRYEGLIMVISMFGIMFFRFKTKKKDLVYSLGAIGVFLLVIMPMALVQLDTQGYDGIFSHVGDGANVAVQDSFFGTTDEKRFFPQIGLASFLKLFGWILIPTFLIFMPLGVFFFCRKPHNTKWELIIIGIFAIIPALYAYSRGISDTKYLFAIYPILIIFVLNCIDWLERKWPRKYNFKIMIIIFLIITSFFFLNYKDENAHNREVFSMLSENIEDMKVVNHLNMGVSSYFSPALLHNENNFPKTQDDIRNNIRIMDIDNYNSIDELLKSEQFINEYGDEIDKDSRKITHLIIDDSPTVKDFLQELYDNETKYPYITKIYDSKDDGYSYQIKIFEINYEIFSLQN